MVLFQEVSHASITCPASIKLVILELQTIISKALYRVLLTIKFCNTNLRTQVVNGKIHMLNFCLSNYLTSAQIMQKTGVDTDGRARAGMENGRPEGDNSSCYPCIQGCYS